MKWEPVLCVTDFILASDVFSKKALSILAESNPPFTWGDNNRSLVTANFIAAHLEQLDNQKLLKITIQRLRSLGETYIDLEN